MVNETYNAQTVPVTGAGQTMERMIRRALGGFPAWFVRAARISRVEVTGRADVREQVAMYEHGTRVLYVSLQIGDLLQKAVGHELAHGCDDNFGNPHYFSSSTEWQRIHREAPFFDIPKYRDEGLEYLADQMVKFFMLGPERMRTTHWQEVTFISTWVVPTLQREFGS